MEIPKSEEKIMNEQGEFFEPTGYPTRFKHDESLRHDWERYTQRSDRCRKCGCIVNEAMSWDGINGSIWNEKCKKSAI